MSNNKRTLRTSSIIALIFERLQANWRDAPKRKCDVIPDWNSTERREIGLEIWSRWNGIRLADWRTCIRKFIDTINNSDGLGKREHTKKLAIKFDLPIRTMTIPVDSTRSTPLDASHL